MTSSIKKQIKQQEAYLVRLSGTIYGPITCDRLKSDFLEGKLSSSCKISIFDENHGFIWVPITESNLFRNISKEQPLPNHNNRWQTLDNPKQHLFIFGDYLVLEGEELSFWDNIKSFFVEPSTGAIPFPAILNISFSNREEGVGIEACTFKEIYEIHSLKCTISTSDARELRKELQKERIRIIDA